MGKNKFKKSAIIIPAVVLLVAVSSIGVASANEYNGSIGNQNQTNHREMHIEIKNAISAGDYEAFLKLIADAPFEVDINEETFAKMVEAHTLMEEGDIEGAHEIIEEIGFPMRGHHRVLPAMNEEQKAVFEDARALREAGEFEKARDLIRESDIELPTRGMGMHRGR